MPIQAPFLRLPPFPGHRASALSIPPSGTSTVVPSAIPIDMPGENLLDRLKRARVGGAFWALPAKMDASRDVVLAVSASSAAPARRAVVDAARSAGVLARALPQVVADGDDVDPWQTCQNATLVIADADSEWALVAALCDTPLHVVGEGRFAGLSDPARLRDIVDLEVGQRFACRDPFTGRIIPAADAIDMLGRWRAMIVSNRSYRQIHGVAGWKRITADALLWDGTGRVRHAHGRHATADAQSGSTVLAWRSRSDGAALAKLEAQGVTIAEIEDGMIRSTGLGANCVPPLSIVVDERGPHFDPAQASDLEILLQDAQIDDALSARAARLRERLVASGISKYGHDGNHGLTEAVGGAVGGEPLQASMPPRRRVLVTAQVEDDRSVLTGGRGLSNLALLQRVRAHEHDAHIVFKPHPDVEAGHRKGHIPDPQVLEHADEIDRTSSIAALLDRVDAVHVLTSLAGFEALMRGREVVTHGVPFYAGWGLTTDLGPVPTRRTRRRTLDELVAAVLILYPRYLDPVTRLPCEPETLVDRIEAGQATVRSPLIRLREMQGRLNRLLDRRLRP